MAVKREHPWYRTHRALNSVYRRLYPTGTSFAKWSRRIAGLMSYGCMVITTVLQFSDAGQNAIPNLLKPIAAWAHSNRLVVAVVCLVSASFFLLVNRIIQWMCQFDDAKMREILDHAVACQFSDQNRGHFQYRATLFKVFSFPPIGSWLGIVCRSGENYLHSNTILSCDRMNQNRCTGVAGECAWQKAIQIVRIEHPQTDKVSYAVAGFLAEPERANFNVRSLVFFAVPITRQDGKLWGVLLLDSTDPGTGVDSDEKKERVKDSLGHWALAIKTAIH
jgi:hypothetical protein